jgi:hypothetical protein
MGPAAIGKGCELTKASSAETVKFCEFSYLPK